MTFQPDIPALDRLNFEIVTGWPKTAGFDPVRNGINYAALLEWRLFSMVARALKLRHGLYDNRLELRLLNDLAAEGYGHLYATVPPLATLHEEAMFRFHLAMNRRRGRKVVFAPFMVRQQRLETLFSDASCSHVFLVNAPIPNFPPPHRLPPIDAAFAKLLRRAIQRGLAAYSLELHSTDAALLREDIQRSMQLDAFARAQVRAIEPDVLLVSTDDGWYPKYFIEAARAAGVPTLLLQHGLDCEPHFFDYCHCDYAALWGKARLRRYVRPPRRAARLTGNPQFDDLRLPNDIATEGRFILLALRPNVTDKLHFPSRSPAIQMALIRSLLEYVRTRKERLVIKLHPNSVAWPVVEAIHRLRSTSRCRLVTGPCSIRRLMEQARVVVTEDSSTGLDAMLAGKPLVFAHFMSCEPTLPMADYNAALPAHNPDELAAALDLSLSLSRGPAQDALRPATFHPRLCRPPRWRRHQAIHDVFGRHYPWPRLK